MYHYSLIEVQPCIPILVPKHESILRNDITNNVEHIQDLENKSNVLFLNISLLNLFSIRLLQFDY